MSYYVQALEFAKQYIEPYAQAVDESGRFPVESFKAMGEQGYFNLLIPTEFGGQGKDMREHTEVVMAFAQSCPSAALCYMMHNVALTVVRSFADEECRRQVFRDVVENRKFLALAFSEFGSGTHFSNPYIKVRYNSEGVILNGSKSMVTSAEQASYYLVIAPSEDGKTVNDWLVPLNTPGVSFAMNDWKGVGMRANVSCPMHFEEVKLPFKYRMGGEGSGPEANAVATMYFVLGLGAVYTGLCKAQCEIATNYSLNREYPNGTKLCNIETVQLHLSNLYTLAAASEGLVREAARSFALQENTALLKILAARIHASENAIKASTIAMRVGGGKGYNKALPIERLMRDSYAGQIMAPSVDVLHLWLGKAMTGQPLH